MIPHYALKYCNKDAFSHTGGRSRWRSMSGSAAKENRKDNFNNQVVSASQTSVKQPRLIAISGPLKGSVFPLPESDWSVGRSSGCQLVLKDTGVSREHCIFRRTGEHCTLRDNNSHNGTFVNGQPIGQKEILQGDQIRLGSSVLLYLTSAEESSSQSSDLKTIELKLQDSLYLSTSDRTAELHAT